MKKLILLACLAASAYGADTMLYMGTWPNQVLQIDEKTYQIVKRIEMKTDVPRMLVLTKDRSKLIVCSH